MLKHFLNKAYKPPIVQLSKLHFSKQISSKFFPPISSKLSSRRPTTFHLTNGISTTFKQACRESLETYKSEAAAENNNQTSNSESSAPNSSNNQSSNTNSHNIFGNNPSSKGPKIKKRSKEMLETTSLGNMKFELLPKEQTKKQSKYILFSSKYPILPHIKIEGMFTTGKLAAEELKHPIAFFLQNDEGSLYTTGVVFEKSINKFIKEHIGEKQKPPSNNPFKNFAESGFDNNSIKSEIVTKNIDYRIKITEIEMNSSGIFVKAIKVKDKKIKDPLKIKEELQRVLELVNDILLMEFVGKPQFYDETILQRIKGVNIKTLSVDDVDIILYNVATLFFKTEFYLNQKPNLIFQTLLETRDLLERVEFIKKKLTALISNFNYQTKISNIVSNDKAQQKIFNKSKNMMASEYIKAVFGISDQNSMNPNVISHGFGGFGAGGTANKLIKSYFDKLHLIKDMPSQDKIKREIDRLSSMDKHSPEHSKILTYLDEIFSIPWSKYSEQYWNIHQTKDILEKNIYGLQKVKERIVEMIAVNKLKGENKKTKGFIILLYGPPGTGKTSVAKSIAKSIKRPYRFISFAGVNDPHFIKGHGRTYVDSQPGIFVKELIKAQTMNPVFILDEIDKLTKTSMGADPYYSLMEILNPEENSNFVDHYLDIKVDFSEVIFILTANDILHMLEPLRNRLEVIEIPPYIQQEKLEIAKNYLIPKLNENYRYSEGAIKFTNEDINQIIKGWCYKEGGVRDLNRCLDKIYRRWSLEIVRKNFNEKEEELESEPNPELLKEETPQTQSIILSDKGFALFEFNNKEKDNLSIFKKLLGPPIFNADLEEKSKLKSPIGVVNVLTVAGFVGKVLTVECVQDLSNPSKKGNFSMSGNLQNVLQESVNIAKINAHNFLTEEQIKMLSQKNIHIHFTEAGTPKDGPSAGISICTAYLSLILNKSIPGHISMTGELSSSGEVCKIGGLQSKFIASKTLNINEIIVPYSNLAEVLEFPQLLLKDLVVYFVKDYKQVFELLFVEKSEKIKDILMMQNGALVQSEPKCDLKLS